MRWFIKTFFTSIVLILFAAWYLPACYYNVFSCDDFWIGTNVRLYGFWGAQKWHWLNWEGSFIYTFLATFPHVFNSMNVAPVFNIVTLGLLIFSVFYFIRAFCVLSKLKSLFIALYLVAVIFTLTRGSSELRFWLSANLPYMVGVSSCILLVSFFHNTKRFTILNRCLSVILCFFIVGNKITYIFFACFCLLLYFLIYKQKNNLIFIFCMIFFFSMFNIFAPGNIVRLHENVGQVSVVCFEMITCVASRVSTVLSSLPTMVLLVSALLPEKACPLSISYFRIILIALVTIAYVVFDSIVMFMCFGNTGPIRTYLLPELALMFLAWILIRKIYFDINLDVLPFFKRGFVAVALFLMIGLQICELQKLDETKLYSEKARIRNEMIKASRKGDCLRLDFLPPSGLLNSYYANDESWILNVYLPYFDKATQCVIKESDN